MVKHLLCNFFSLYKSRLAVLSDVLLQNGGNWVENENGEYVVHLETYNGDPEYNKTEIPMLSEDRIGKLNFSDGEVDFENSIRSVINRNLDEYSKKGFNKYYANFNPIKIPSFSKDFSLIGTAPDNISQEWKDAIIEISDYFMDLMNTSGFNKKSKEALEHVRQSKPNVANQYLILMNATERFTDNEKELRTSEYMNEIISKITSSPTDEELYIELNLENNMSFERFNKLVKLRADTNDTRTSKKEYISNIVKFEKKYIENGAFNNDLYERLEKGLNSVSYSYLQFDSIVSQATYRMGIPSIYKDKINNWFYDKVSSSLACS